MMGSFTAALPFFTPDVVPLQLGDLWFPWQFKNFPFFFFFVKKFMQCLAPYVHMIEKSFTNVVSYFV